MNALRFLLIALAASLGACASTPATPTAEAPRAVAPIADVRATPLERVAETPSTLEKIVLALRADMHTAVVFTNDGKASDAAAKLRRAGLEVDVVGQDFGRVGDAPKWCSYDVIVIEGRPTTAAGKHAELAEGRGTPVVATWTGERSDERARALELVERTGDASAWLLIWHSAKWALDGRDLAAHPVLPDGFELSQDGSATIVGRPCRLPSGADILMLGEWRQTRIVLKGPKATKLAGRPSCADGALEMAAVRARVRFSEHLDPVTVWEADVDEVRFHLDETAMRALTRRHAKAYARAVKHVDRGELAAAASALEESAKIVDDAYEGRGDVASREVRFAREMARRLRDIEARGGETKALLERVASFDPLRGDERDLLDAANRLAQSRLEREYRKAKTDTDAEAIARLYAYAISIRFARLTPTLIAMYERFPRLRYYQHERSRDDSSGDRPVP